MYKPTKKHVFIKPHVVEQTSSGIFLPNMGLGHQAPTRGCIVGAGEGCEEVSVGDNVLFEAGTGLRYNINGEDVLLLAETHIFAII
jgi:co-chaperonin GroES (HSP10)